MNYSYNLIIIVDIICILFSIFLLRGKLSFFHPFSMYLFFHLFAFTKRLWEIVIFNYSLLYSNNINARAISLDEISRAIIWADIALVVFAFACKIAYFLKVKKNKIILLNKEKVNLVAFAFFLPGVFAFIKSYNIDSFDSQFNQILTIMRLWPLLSICLLIYYYGFRWYLLLLISPFMILLLLQGYHRFMIILPLLFLISIYLYNKKLRWPNIRIVIILIATLLIFPQLKYIGMAYSNKNYDEILLRLQQSIIYENTLELERSPNDFLDQYAGALTLIDESGKFYYGSTYISIITVFIPRILWDNKPGLGDHTVALATNDRPYDKEGRIITYLGEAYINFWYIGILIIPFILGILLTRSYIANINTGIRSLQAYVFISFNIILIQVFRDGIASLSLFGILQNLIMVWVYVLHKFKFK